MSLPPRVLHQGGLPRLSMTLDSILTSLLTSLVRFTLQHANFCSVLTALVISLVSPSSPSSVLTSQSTVIGLLVVSFFAQGCLFLWAVIAGEAPISGSSFAAQVREVALKSVWLGKGMGLPSPLAPKPSSPTIKVDPRQQTRPLNVYRTSSAAALASDLASPSLSSGGVVVPSSVALHTLDGQGATASADAAPNGVCVTPAPAKVKTPSQRLVYMPPSVLNGVFVPGAFVPEDLMRKSQEANTLMAKLKVGLKSILVMCGSPRKAPPANKSVRRPCARNVQVLGLCCGRLLPKGVREALWVWWEAQGRLQWGLLVGGLLWLAVGVGAPFVVCRALSPSLGGDSGVGAVALVVVPALADTLALAHTGAAFEGPLLGSSSWLAPLPTLLRLLFFSLVAPVIFTASLGLLPTHLHLWSPVLAALKSSLVVFTTGDGSAGKSENTAASLLLSSWPFAQYWVVYPLVSTAKSTGLLFSIVGVPYLAPCVLSLLARGAFQGVRGCSSLRNFCGLRGGGGGLKGSALSRRGAGSSGRPKSGGFTTALPPNQSSTLGTLPATEDSSTASGSPGGAPSTLLMALPAFLSWLSFSTTAAALAGMLMDVGAREWLLGTNGMTLEDFSKAAPLSLDGAISAYDPTLYSGLGNVAFAARQANLTSVKFALAQGLEKEWGNTAAKLSPLASSAAAAASVLFMSCAFTFVMGLVGTGLRCGAGNEGKGPPPDSVVQANRHMSSVCLPHIVFSGRNLACGLALAASLTLEGSHSSGTSPKFVRASIAAAFAFHALFFHVFTVAVSIRSLFLDLSHWVVSHAASGGLDALSFTRGGGLGKERPLHFPPEGNLAAGNFPTGDSTPPTSLTQAQTAHLDRLHSLFTLLPYVILLQTLGVVFGFQTRHSACCLIASYIGLSPPSVGSVELKKDDPRSFNTHLPGYEHNLPEHPQGRLKPLAPSQPRRPQHVVFVEVGAFGGEEKGRLEKEGEEEAPLPAAPQSATPRTKVKFGGYLSPPLAPPIPTSTLPPLPPPHETLVDTQRSQPILVPIPDPSGRAPFILVPLLRTDEGSFGGKDPPLPSTPALPI